MEKITNLPIDNLPSAVILIKATSAGVPTNAPTQPAAIPSTAFTMKFGCVSFLNEANILDINSLRFLYKISYIKFLCKILYTKLTFINLRRNFQKPCIYTKSSSGICGLSH